MKLKMLASLSIRTIGALLSFAASVILARWLGPETYGSYALILSWAAVCSIPVTLGFPTLLIRESALAKARSSLGTLRGLLRFSTMAAFALSVLIVGLAFVALTLNPEISNAMEFSAVIGIIVPLTALDMIRRSIMQGLGSAVRSQIPEALLRPAILLSTLSWGVFHFDGNRLHYGLGAYGFAMLTSYIAATWMLSGALPNAMRAANPLYEHRMWTMAVVSLGALSATQTWIGNADLILLGGLAPASETGQYKVALQGVALIALAQTAIGSVTTTHLAKFLADGNKKEVARLSGLSTIVAFAGTAVATLLVYFFGGDVIRLAFGAEFLPAQSILLILAIGHLGNAASGPSLSILSLSNNQRGAFLIALLGIAVTLGAALALVQSQGAQGMALSSALGLNVMKFGWAVMVQNRLGFDPSIIGFLMRRRTQRV